MELHPRELLLIRRILAEVDTSLIELASMHEDEEDYEQMFRAEVEIDLSETKVHIMRELLTKITNHKIQEGF